MEETCTIDINLPEEGIVSEDVAVINVKECCNVDFELQDNTPGLKFQLGVEEEWIPV